MMDTIAHQFLTSSAYVATSVSEDKENESMVQKFKTRVCRHFESGRTCPMGTKCSFAHGEHELTSKNKAAGKKKTRICVSFAPGGSGYCKEGLACDFLHPTDGHLFNTAVQFQIEKEQFNFTVQAIHSKRRFCKTQEESDGLEDVINQMVRLWNQKWPKGAFYFDLHAMTIKGAAEYVEDIIVCMKINNQKMCWLETGRGNHSTYGFAAIRTLLLAKYQGSGGVVATPDQSNPGIVILTIL